MTSKLENCPCAKPAEKSVTYPCLMEDSDGIALVHSEKERSWLTGIHVASTPSAIMAGATTTWKQRGLKPCVGPRTITFEN